MPSCCTVTITYVDNDLPVARGACGRLPGLRRKASSAPSSTEEAMMAAAAAAAPAAEPGRSGHRPSRLFLNPSHAPSRGGALPDSRGARAVPPSPSDGITAPSMACRGRLPVPGAVFGQRASNGSKLLQASHLRAVDSDVSPRSATTASDSPRPIQSPGVISSNRTACCSPLVSWQPTHPKLVLSSHSLCKYTNARTRTLEDDSRDLLPAPDSVTNHKPRLIRAWLAEKCRISSSRL